MNRLILKKVNSLSLLVLLCAILLLGSCIREKDNKIPGDKIIFSSREGIYSIKGDGNELKQLIYDSSAILPCWSPDGREISFISKRDNPEQDIYLCDTSGKKVRRLTNLGKGTCMPKWSPDGKWILFEKGYVNDQELYIIDTTGKIITQLTKNEVLDRNPCWAPDSKQIAFARSRERDKWGYDIFTMNIDSMGMEKQITNDSLVAYKFPAWSPDGNKIAFLHIEKTKQGIWIMNIDGSNRKKIMDNASHASWSSDSKKLAVSGNDGKIHIVDVQDTSLNQIITQSIDAECFDAECLVIKKSKFFSRHQDDMTQY